MVKDVLKEPAILAGLLLTFSLIGNVLGGLSFAFLYKRNIKLHIIYLCSLLIMGVMIFLISVYSIKYVFLTSFLVLGFLGTIISNWSFTKVQQTIDKRYMGRVGSFANIALLAATPVASYIGGILIDKIEIIVLFRYISYILILIGLVYFILAKNLLKKNTTNTNIKAEAIDLIYNKEE